MNVKHNVSQIKRLFQERKETIQAFSRFLISKGISLPLAEEILLELAREGKEITSIHEVAARRVRITGELSFEHLHRLVFVGPTGVGKTTTLLKLADYYLKQKRRVALMTLDESKKESLRSWAEKKQIPYVEQVADTTAELLLIDTEGCNFYHPNRVDDLGEKVAECGEGIEILLTLSAAAKEVDLYGAVHQFSSLDLSSLVFTKLDETLASGVLINVCVKTDIPIRYIAYGYPLPGEVQVADPKAIMHKILTDFNKEEFQFLRQLTLPALN
jgi:flagellar biosynthesis protein FlhF